MITIDEPRPDPYSLTGVAVALADLKTQIRDELAQGGLVIGQPDPAGGLLLLAWMEIALEHHVELMGPAFVREHVNDLLDGHSVEAVLGTLNCTVRSAEA